MGNRICQKCGEEYSDTYRTCPFCEEDEAIRQGRPLHRQGGKRLEKQRNSGGAGGVMLLLTGIIIMGALAYVFFGDQIEDTLGIRADPADLGFVSDDEADPDTSDVTPPVDNTIVPESPLKISQTAMTLAVGETALLTLDGMEGEVSWFSSNIEVATVDNGAVTAQAPGTATVSAIVEGESAACTVEVEGDSEEPPVSDTGASTQPSGGGSTTSNKKLTLNKTDFSLRPGDPIVTMKVSGTDSKVTWASKDTSIAAINENGVVTWVSVGTTTITATVDGQTLECIVRCKS